MNVHEETGFDYASIEPEIKAETDELIVVPAVIAREIVQPYRDRKAYKPAEELEKAAWTAEGRWVTTDHHPDTLLLVRPDDIRGRIQEPRFVKNLMDPKTQRPCRKGIRADIALFKLKLPPGFVEEIKQGLKKDVSIGFTSEDDETPGEWEGQHYDYVQRNIFIDHVAVGVPVGRCPSPLCGLGVDEILQEDDKCPISGEIRKLGIKESCRRLAAAFGQDAISVLKGEQIQRASPRNQDASVNDVKLEADEVARSRELIRDIRRLRSRSTV